MMGVVIIALGVKENHRPVTSYRQILSHNVLSTPRHEQVTYTNS
jgi:hypothetical protein